MELSDLEALDACLSASSEEPVWILKHSTACPVSSAAYERVVAYAGEGGEACPSIYLIKVIEARPVSNAIAERLSLQHQSPQIMLVRGGKAIWSTSHFSITADNMEAALAQSA